jgi:hypothetical protein
LIAFDHSDVGALSNHDWSRGNGAHYLKINCLSESRHTHNSADDNRNALEILEHSIGCDGRGCSANPQRRQAHCDRLLAVDSCNDHLFLQASTAIAAAGSIDLDHAVVGFGGKLGASNCRGAAGDLQDIACFCAHALQIPGRQAGNRAAYVLDAGLGDSQRESRRQR